MASEYQLTTPDPDGPVLRLADMAWIPDDPGNRDWQEYQQWLADGGMPDPYVEPPEPPLPQPSAIVTFNFTGRPAANAMVQRVVVAVRTIPPNLEGSQAYVNTKAKGSAIFTLTNAATGDVLGSISFDSSSNYGALAGIGGDVAVGEVLQMTAPSSMDQTLADVAISIVGT